MGLLLFLAGAFWTIQLVKSEEWIYVSLVVFVGVPVLSSWLIILERHRDQIREERMNRESPTEH